MNKKGFTLVEILVSIGLLALLGSINQILTIFFIFCYILENKWNIVYNV